VDGVRPSTRAPGLRVSRFLSRNLVQEYTTSPAKWSTRKSPPVERLSNPKCGFFDRFVRSLALNVASVACVRNFFHRIRASEDAKTS